MESLHLRMRMGRQFSLLMANSQNICEKNSIKKLGAGKYFRFLRGLGVSHPPRFRDGSKNERKIILPTKFIWGNSFFLEADKPCEIIKIASCPSYKKV